MEIVAVHAYGLFRMPLLLYIGLLWYGRQMLSEAVRRILRTLYIGPRWAGRALGRHQPVIRAGGCFPPTRTGVYCRQLRVWTPSASSGRRRDVKTFQA